MSDDEPPREERYEASQCYGCGATPEDSDLEICSLCDVVVCDNCRQEWVDEMIDDCGVVCVKCVEKNLRQQGGGP